MSNPSLVFYQRAHVPEKWTLYDVLLWVACKILPEIFVDSDGYPARQSFDTFSEYFPNFGTEFVDYFEETYTEKLGLKPDPVFVNMQRDSEGGEYLHSPDFYDIKFTLDDEDENKKYVAEQTRLKEAALLHQDYTNNWRQDFDECMDEYKSIIHVALRSGELVGAGIKLSYNYSEDPEEFYDRFSKSYTNNTSFLEAYRSIEKSNWIRDGIDWEQSLLKYRKDIHLAIVFAADDILKLFPPENNGGGINAYMMDDHFFLLEKETNNKIDLDRTKKPGRPKKSWEIIEVKIAETIAHDGHLPSKQDAYAQFLKDFYIEETGQDIGLSTIKAKLKPYYQNKKLRKSRK